MNVALVAAGVLGLLAAAIHGIAGEVLVVRKLSPRGLPSTTFGGAVMTRTMIQVSWHIATFAFLTAGCSLLLSGSVLDNEAGRAIALVGATAFTGFAAVALGLGVAHTRSLRPLVRHPGPAALAATAALAWWGAL